MVRAKHILSPKAQLRMGMFGGVWFVHDDSPLLLLGSFLLEPLVEVLLRIVDGQKPSHPVVCEAAQFSAGNFIGPRPVGSKPDLDRHSWHGVLLDPQIRQKETVDYVLRAASNFHRPARQNVHLADGNDVVLCRRVGSVKADIVCRRDHFGIGSTKRTVRTWIVEIPGELFTRDLDDEGVCRCIDKIYRCPYALAHKDKDRENRSEERRVGKER